MSNRKHDQRFDDGALVRSDFRDAGHRSGTPHKTAQLCAQIQRALELSDLTEGAFDITYDSVGQFYDYRQKRRPGEEQIARSLPSIGYRLVELDPQSSTIRFAHPGVRINLGGIAKGYACEAVAAVLAARGVTNALVTAGGDSRSLGDRGDGPWIFGIRDPDDPAACPEGFRCSEHSLICERIN